MMSPGELFFRRYRLGDEEAILRLLESTPGLGISLEQWAWLFPPEKGGRLIMVGEIDGNLVAACSGTPARVTVDGREWEAVELYHIATSGSADPGVMVDKFVETFGSTGRFSAVTAVSVPGGDGPPGFTAADAGRISVFVRRQPAAASFSRLLYRAERSRDWEPRLDDLWRRARSFYPVAFVRDAERALRRFAAKPVAPIHRFLICPRFSSRAVAFAAFAVDGGRCRWLDLIWDHRHPGALELLARISGRLVAQLGADGEELWIAGDDGARALLMHRGFVVDESPTPRISARSLVPELDVASFVDRCYLTLSDCERIWS